MMHDNGRAKAEAARIEAATAARLKAKRAQLQEVAEQMVEDEPPLGEDATEAKEAVAAAVMGLADRQSAFLGSSTDVRQGVKWAVETKLDTEPSLLERMVTATTSWWVRHPTPPPKNEPKNVVRILDRCLVGCMAQMGLREQ